ncbi:hypothetical protein ACH4UT_18435 [Streptomyces sp. NPDC020799]|uniref:hypothetical protein n=1 Tax=Streptomyces sp. NPDC020799 TaxID=3365091 RepID=UPI0037B4EF0B
MEFLLGLEVSMLGTVVTAAEVHKVEFGFTAVPDGDLYGPVPGLGSQPCAVLESAVFWGVPQFSGDPTCAEKRSVLGKPCRVVSAPGRFGGRWLLSKIITATG